MFCPAWNGPLLPSSSSLRCGSVTTVGKECALPGEDEKRLIDPIVSQPKLRLVANRSASDAAISRMVPANQTINSMRPGFSSHQRTLSRGLRRTEDEEG